jgi:nicotinamide mononucleotide transporter
MPPSFFNLPLVSLITAIEWLSAALGLLSVIGNLKLHRWGWLTQAASGIGYGIVFFHQGLFGLAMLQVYFVVVALWAWWLWSSTTFDNASKIRYLNFRQVCIALATWAITTAVLGLTLLKAGEGNTAYIDAFTTAGSILAQWLMLRYFVQTWYVWIVVNFVSVGLFFYSNLLATSLLYCVFTVLAVVGARSWKQQLRAIE